MIFALAFAAVLLFGASEAQETGEEAIKVVVDESPVAAAKESNDEIEKLVSKREIDGDEIFRDQLEQTLMEQKMIQDQLIEELLMEPRWWKGERRGRWGRRRWGGRRRGERRGGYYSDEEDESKQFKGKRLGGVFKRETKYETDGNRKIGEVD